MRCIRSLPATSSRRILIPPPSSAVWAIWPQGVDTLVFRTESRETALDIDTMLSLGTEDTLFTLTHSGSSATLTVGGADHSELIH